MTVRWIDVSIRPNIYAIDERIQFDYDCQHMLDIAGHILHIYAVSTTGMRAEFTLQTSRIVT